MHQQQTTETTPPLSPIREVAFDPHIGQEGTTFSAEFDIALPTDREFHLELAFGHQKVLSQQFASLTDTKHRLTTIVPPFACTKSIVNRVPLYVYILDEKGQIYDVWHFGNFSYQFRDQLTSTQRKVKHTKVHYAQQDILDEPSITSNFKSSSRRPSLVRPLVYHHSPKGYVSVAAEESSSESSPALTPPTKVQQLLSSNSPHESLDIESSHEYPFSTHFTNQEHLTPEEHGSRFEIPIEVTPVVDPSYTTASQWPLFPYMSLQMPWALRPSTTLKEPPVVPSSTPLAASSDNMMTALPDKQSIVEMLRNTKLEIQGDLNTMVRNWTEYETTNCRRLVQFRRRQENNLIHASFAALNHEDRTPNAIIVSCIWWKSKNEYYITSVDCVSLLEALIAVRFTVEEKNRIRRNLEGFKPLTAGKNSKDSDDLFRLIMGFSNPKPRNIEKNVKVFPWKHLANALHKIVNKYCASMTSVDTDKTKKSSNQATSHDLSISITRGDNDKEKTDNGGDEDIDSDNVSKTSSSCTGTDDAIHVTNDLPSSSANKLDAVSSIASNQETGLLVSVIREQQQQNQEIDEMDIQIQNNAVTNGLIENSFEMIATEQTQQTEIARDFCNSVTTTPTINKEIPFFSPSTSSSSSIKRPPKRSAKKADIKNSRPTRRRRPSSVCNTNTLSSTSSSGESISTFDTCNYDPDSGFNGSRLIQQQQTKNADDITHQHNWMTSGEQVSFFSCDVITSNNSNSNDNATNTTYHQQQNMQIQNLHHDMSTARTITMTTTKSSPDSTTSCSSFHEQQQRFYDPYPSPLSHPGESPTTKEPPSTSSPRIIGFSPAQRQHHDQNNQQHQRIPIASTISEHLSPQTIDRDGFYYFMPNS
ncbi:959_t:CDS:2 [Ambispora gerdemannii]|uniref:959_t:CDS:1 n=1 Tax=Ambispora gerdemannii TaxID=144530 RepID=A0A9N8W563_9GLOM|nr:959_t:CDS:2 [Ambispora gerdemannii]